MLSTHCTQYITLFLFQVAPVKITRSVGLQVITQEQKRLQEQGQLAGAGAGARIATKPAQAVVIRNANASPVTPSGQVRITPVKASPNNNGQVKTPTLVNGPVPSVATRGIRTHPAALPLMPQRQPSGPDWKLMPAKPSIKIDRNGAGIVLSWNLAFTTQTHATIVTYQLYAYQESGAQVPDTSLWKKVGDVKALPLPMACTLTQFQGGNKYHIAVRAKDCHNRLGPFSDPQNITLN